MPEPGAAPAVVEHAPAKINLFLLVTGRRPDGYHLLDSLAVFADVADVLHAAPAETLSLELAGPFAGALGAVSDNLVLRAARALAAAGGVAPRAHLVLEKNLPVAAGIGGGSADAAAALRALARLWGLAADLPALAAGLGADVPVCLLGRAARMAGSGEVLSPAPALPRCGIVLLNPGLALATAEVFAARTGAFSAPARLPASWPDVAAMAADLERLRNDLEPAAITLCPAVATALATLRASGCLLARMSGSGATCFGLFPTQAAASAAARAVSRPGWWARAGRLMPPEESSAAARRSSAFGRCRRGRR